MASKPIIAVIGAGGFIGRHLVERLRKSERYDVRPIARRPTTAGANEKIADAFDTEALTLALAGCTFVVHAVAGDRNTILGTIEPAYRAAERAGCRRMVYLSSAVVHGQAPASDTTEASPLSRDQPVDYNLSKILAEEMLLDLRRRGSVEVSILRPGIVYGPGSHWSDGLAREIIGSRAYLVDGGPGLCNAIHVDNVLHAILLASEAEEADGQAFLLGEDGRITWREFYGRIADAIGRSRDDIPSVEYVRAKPPLAERLENMRSIPRPLRKRLIKLVQSVPTAPQPTLEMALLHRSQYLPSWDKAKRELGYRPCISAEEGWRQTAAWLTAVFAPKASSAHG